MERVIWFSLGKGTKQEKRERRRIIKRKEDSRRLADHLN
jgi:hypothetical protein